MLSAKRLVVMFVIIGLAEGLSAACAPDKQCGPSNAGEVELVTWWASKSEKDALTALRDYHKERTGTEFRPFPVPSATAAQATVADLMAKQIPPATFQTNIGADLFQWLGDDAKNFQSLTILDVDLAKHLHPDVVAQVSRDGSPYCVPLGIHRVNTLYYNARILKEFSIAAPTTLQELKDACDVLKDQKYWGKAIAPIGVTLKDSALWTFSLLVHESLLPAVAGTDFYEQFWTGSLNIDDPSTVDALRSVYQTVVDWSKQKLLVDLSVDWDNIDLFSDSRPIAFVAMGNWYTGELILKHKKKLGEDFGVVAFPSDRGQGVFVFTADCFPLPNSQRNQKDAVDLLNTFALPEGQVRFCGAKGCFPARLDFSTHEESMQAALTEFRAASRVLAVSGLQPPGVVGDYGAALKNMMEDQDVDWLLRFWKHWYARLKNP